MKNCEVCGHPHEGGALACILTLKTAMRNLLTRIVSQAPKPCDGKAKGGVCDVPVYWVTHANGKRVPYTEAGLNHFVDCPDRQMFHGAKR